jgi:hypothetical protein
MPICPAACQTPNDAPQGSSPTSMRPLPGMSNGSMSTLPPAAPTSFAVASASSLAR